MNGSGTDVLYKVEVRDTRFNAKHPAALADGIVGPDWREVEFAEGTNPAGVPADSFFAPRGISSGYLPYESALALAWTTIAQNMPYGHCTLECRIVRYRLTYSCSSERVGVVDGSEIQSQLFASRCVVPEEQEEEVEA